MRRLFKVGADRHGNGKVIVAWHPDGNFLATAGKNGKQAPSCILFLGSGTDGVCNERL